MKITQKTFLVEEVIACASAAVVAARALAKDDEDDLLLSVSLVTAGIIYLQSYPAQSQGEIMAAAKLACQHVYENVDKLFAVMEQQNKGGMPS